MEKKLKFSEFAELIGVTAKTVYKMKDREEIKTVIEKVNGREIQLVVTNLEEIEKFRLMNGKGTNNNRNYEDILTDYEMPEEDNNSIQTRNNVTVMEMFDKTMLLNQEFIRQINELNDKHNERILELSEEYNDRIKELNDELLKSEKQVQLLEDKAGREGFYLNEINELKKENERVIETQNIVKNRLLVVVVILLLVLVNLITSNVGKSKVNESDEQKKEPVQQMEVVQPVEPVKNNKNR